MVARISMPKRLLAALNYNENKLKKGLAECIGAGNYLLQGKDMNFFQKLAGLENRNSLNERALTKTLHISLNFDPAEKHTSQKLMAIANSYMQKIGFEQQPYLVYQHHDAGHPHIHIVTSAIKADGSRINTHNIGRNQSEKARRDIELSFNLIKAEKQTKLLKQKIPTVNLAVIDYGKSETKRSIENIVTVIFNEYRYTSLPEFNAALRQFNITADRGEEDSRLFKKQGLVYRLLDPTGNKIGVPVKASLIYSKPTLKNLAEKFLQNEALRKPRKQLLTQIIDRVIENKIPGIQAMVEALKNEKVFTLLRQNEDGRLYGITFVDNISKCVYNGSSLGKGYSAAALLLKTSSSVNIQKLYTSSLINQQHIQLNLPQKIHQPGHIHITDNTKFGFHINTPTPYNENIPFELRKRKKKKKRK